MTDGDNSPLELLPAGHLVASQGGKARDDVVALYGAHQDAIYRFLVGQGLSPAVAQEITQDVFVDLFVALEKGSEIKSQQAWLYTVAGRAIPRGKSRKTGR